VRDEQTAVAVSASLQPFQRLSFFSVTVDVKPGQDADAVTQRLDQIIAELIASGPTADEIQRVATTQIAQSTFAIEQIGGFTGATWALADGQIMTGNPGYFRSNLLEYGQATPESVRAAMKESSSR
jgi:hypothetical protein